jgi:hypothetical protein
VITAGVRTVSWLDNADVYHIRFDDETNPWKGKCSLTQYAGDVCINDYPYNSIDINFEAGHTYEIWIHSENSCGANWVAVAQANVSVLPLLPQVTGLNAACSAAGDSVTLSWNSVAGADRYVARINQSPYTDWFNGSGGDQWREPSTNYVTTSVTPGAWYRYSVQPIRDTDVSPFPHPVSSEIIFRCEAPPPPTVNVVVPYNAVTAPSSFNASWSSTNATSCTGSGRFAGLSGLSRTKSETNLGAGTYTYTATCYNAAGVSATDTETVTVYNAPSVTINAPTYATAPASYSASWSSSNASACTGSSRFSGYTGTSRSRAETNLPVGTYTYSVTCVNPAGATASATKTTTVVAAPTVSINAPSNLFAPASYSVTWNSGNAVSCTGSSRLSGKTALNGSMNESGLGIGTYEYRMSCQNQAGTVVQASAVTTVAIAPPTVDLKVDGGAGFVDGPVTVFTAPASFPLAWTTERANTCVASSAPFIPDWNGSVPVNSGGTVVGNVPYRENPYTLTITCSNASGVVSDTVLVTVGEPLEGSIFSQYSGLVYRGPALNPPYGPLACQRLYGTIEGGQGPYTVVVSTFSVERGDSANGVVYDTLNTNGFWETTAEPLPGDPAVCANTLFGTDYEGEWSAWIYISDSVGNVYLSRDYAPPEGAQGSWPHWDVGDYTIYSTP